VGQKIACELAVTPVVKELQRVPQSHERKDIVSLGRLEMQTKNEVDIVPSKLRVRRIHKLREGIDLQALETERSGGDLQPGDALILCCFQLRPQLDYCEFAVQLVNHS
jgi:hypothetical protein